MGLGLRDAFSNLNIILFGLGWWQYQSPPNKYTRIFLRRLLLNSSVKHSVRDKYTLDMLATIGIHNALNTSCPTTWTLTPDHCSKVPTAKGKSVISTLTDYSKSPSADTEMISTLLKAYDKVYLWLQGLDDYRYLRDLGFSNHHNIIQIPPCLTAYERVLSFDDLDYIGTRLHAGIKAIQCGKRALIMSVDNRAHEISEDINLPVAPRGAIHAIDHFIQSSRPTEIRLPSLAITQWKNQFTT
jgi:polysaccharide pyruvyl transferase WcaK-like protein